MSHFLRDLNFYKQVLLSFRRVLIWSWTFFNDDLFCLKEQTNKQLDFLRGFHCIKTISVQSKYVLNISEKMHVTADLLVVKDPHSFNFTIMKRELIFLWNEIKSEKRWSKKNLFFSNFVIQHYIKTTNLFQTSYIKSGTTIQNCSYMFNLALEDAFISYLEKVTSQEDQSLENYLENCYGKLQY